MKFWLLLAMPCDCEIMKLSYFHAGADSVFIYPCQDIKVGTLRLSDMVMILSWHEGEGLTLQFLRSRFGFGLGFRLGLGLGWIFGSDGTDDSLLPLVICDLGHGIVLVHLRIEFLDLSMLQLTLERKRISGNALEMLQDRTYYLCVVVVRGPKSSDRLSIISKCMILVCCQI